MSDDGYKDPETLRRLYHDEGMTQAEIAERFDVHDMTISRHLRENDIETRRPNFSDVSEAELLDELRRLRDDLEKSPSQRDMERDGEYSVSTYQRVFESWSGAKEAAGVETFEPDTGKIDVSYRDEETLRRLYHDEGLSQPDIAERFDCDRKTIGNWMDRFGIEVTPGETIRRKLGTGEEHHNWNRETRDCDHCGDDVTRRPSEFTGEKAFCNRVCATAYVAEHPEEYVVEIPDDELLAELGRLADEHGDELPFGDIRKHGRYDPQTYIRRFGSLPDAREEAGLKKHVPFGKRGIRKYPGNRHPYGDSWEESRQERLEVDDYQCVICGRGRQEQIEQFGRDLNVHHIIRAGRFDDLERADRVENLRTLCQRCHPKWEGVPVFPPSTSYFFP